ncbi:MAG: hypothetical protein LUE26_04540 [Alistipes sp.]|nr:hypothetical protein [Alistipes sp.]
MLSAKKCFDDSIIRVRQDHSLYSHLTGILHFSHENVADILRSEIVYAVSAFDRLIHDIIRVGIIEIYNSLRPATVSYDNFQICMSHMRSILNPLPNTNPHKLLEDIIINKHKYIAYQDPDKISEGLSLIWHEQHKWQKIASLMSMTDKNVKIELKNIVIRRNQIVHESDIDLFTQNLQPINDQDVMQSVDFLDLLGNTIFNLVKIP